MKKLLLLSIILIPFYISSQDLDPAYLASLPDDVRADLMAKQTMREEMDKPIYRRASTMIDKEESEIVLLSKSVRFGAKIFDVMQSSFMPINEPNFDGSYILDFGDSLSVQLIGQKNMVKELVIARDGSINLPDLGKLFVSGLSLESASELIKGKVSSAFIGTDAFISLTNIRDIQILVSGNTFNPGIYTLNGNSNALHALSMAGGIDPDGSYRIIDIMRDGKVINTLDLYDIFIFGKFIYGSRLRSGDSIVVRPSKFLVTVSTGVKRPSTYELIEGETFKDLIIFANGLSDKADLSYLAIESFDKNLVLRKEVASISDLNNIKAKSGDTLFIQEYDYRSVTIKGAVSIPGTYVIQPGETLSGVIERAGGYTEFAYPFGGFLNNVKTLQINEEAKKKLHDKFVVSMLLNSRSIQSPSESVGFILNQINNSSTSGRVSAEFDLDAIDGNKLLDTKLEDGDELLIPYITQQVYIYGQVNNPGTSRYKAGKNLDYYIDNAGSFDESADAKRIFIIHPNGKTDNVERSSRRKLSFLSQSNDILIYPGSIIYVPRESSIKDASLIASIWAPIISSLALSLTSLSVVSNQ